MTVPAYGDRTLVVPGRVAVRVRGRVPVRGGVPVRVRGVGTLSPSPRPGPGRLALAGQFGLGVRLGRGRPPPPLTRADLRRFTGGRPRDAGRRGAGPRPRGGRWRRQVEL